MTKKKEKTMVKLIKKITTPAKKDLKTRERVGVVLDVELIKKLRNYSKKTDIPVSRLLDRAIKETYKF